jgi:hypothetical protein
MEAVMIDTFMYTWIVESSGLGQCGSVHLSIYIIAGRSG